MVCLSRSSFTCYVTVCLCKSRFSWLHHNQRNPNPSTRITSNPTRPASQSSQPATHFIPPNGHPACAPKPGTTTIPFRCTTDHPVTSGTNSGSKTGSDGQKKWPLEESALTDKPSHIQRPRVGAELAAAKATSSANGSIDEEKVSVSSDKRSMVQHVKGSVTQSKNVDDGQKKKRPLEESALNDKRNHIKRARFEGAATEATTRPLSMKPQAVNTIRKTTTISAEPKNEKKRTMEQGQRAEKNTTVKCARRDKDSQSNKPATIVDIGAKGSATGVDQSQTTLTTEAKQVQKRSLENDGDVGETPVVKRARIDHADPATSAEKTTSTKPSTVEYQTYKGLGSHRKLAVQVEDRKMVLDGNNRAKQALREKEITRRRLLREGSVA
jgi:hypothetical protein